MSQNENRAVRVNEAASDGDHLALEIGPVPVPEIGAGQCLIEIGAAGVNPSDVKATLGLMQHAIWPRTPGRDYGGVVREGPAELIGKEVWGSGGELGIRRDGTHARYLVVEAAAVREKPSTISLEEAGAIGVPFITAYEGLREAGGVAADDVVLVLGGNGKVGQAAIQLATMAGARVFAVERHAQPFLGHASNPVQMIDASAVDLAEAVREGTGGHGADIVYNTVGSPYFEAANRAMAISTEPGIGADAARSFSGLMISTRFHRTAERKQSTGPRRVGRGSPERRLRRSGRTASPPSPSTPPGAADSPGPR